MGSDLEGPGDRRGPEGLPAGAHAGYLIPSRRLARCQDRTQHHGEGSVVAPEPMPPRPATEGMRRQRRVWTGRSYMVYSLFVPARRIDRKIGSGARGPKASGAGGCIPFPSPRGLGPAMRGEGGPMPRRSKSLCRNRKIS